MRAKSFKQLKKQFMVLQNISLRELEFFRETLKSGSATRAADRLGVSQPAVSRALARLEERMALSLFTRNDGRLTPTAAAYALESELEPVFSSLENITQFSEQPVASETEILRIAVPPTFCICIMQPLISEFMAKYPHSRFHLQTCTSQEVIQKIAIGEADLGMSDNNLTHDGIRFETILEIDAVCVLRDDHPLAERDQIIVEDMDDLPLIAMSRSFSSRYALERIFEKAGVTPRIALEVTTSFAACDFISKGLGVGIMNPYPVLDGPYTNLITRPFSPSVVYKTRLLTSTNIRQGWLMQTFGEYLKEQASIRLGRVLGNYGISPPISG